MWILPYENWDLVDWVVYHRFGVYHWFLGVYHRFESGIVDSWTHEALASTLGRNNIPIYVRMWLCVWYCGWSHVCVCACVCDCGGGVMYAWMLACMYVIDRYPLICMCVCMHVWYCCVYVCVVVSVSVLMHV